MGMNDLFGMSGIGAGLESNVGKATIARIMIMLQAASAEGLNPEECISEEDSNRVKEIQTRLDEISNRQEEIEMAMRLEPEPEEYKKLSEEKKTLIKENRKLIDEITNIKEKAEKVMTQKIVKNVVDEAFDKINDWRPFIMELLNERKGDVIGATNDLAGILADFSEGTREVSARLAKCSAEHKRDKFRALQNAGFTADQAFTLLLAEIKPMNFTQEVMKKVAEKAQRAAAAAKKSD